MQYLVGVMMRPSMLSALSEDVEVAGKGQVALKNLASRGKSFSFFLHQTHGLSLASTVPRSIRYLLIDQYIHLNVFQIDNCTWITRLPASL